MAFKKFEKPRPFREGAGQPQMYQGDWACADCGVKITELPFQPSADRPIYCRECHAKRRSQFRR